MSEENQTCKPTGFSRGCLTETQENLSPSERLEAVVRSPSVARLLDIDLLQTRGLYEVVKAAADYIADEVASRLQKMDRETKSAHSEEKPNEGETEFSKGIALSILDALGVKDNPRAVSGYRVVPIPNPNGFDPINRVQIRVNCRLANLPREMDTPRCLRHLLRYLAARGIPCPDLSADGDSKSTGPLSPPSIDTSPPVLQ